MSQIKTLSETESAARMIFLNSDPVIDKPASRIDRNVRELRASAPAGVHRPPAPAVQPRTLAEAIRFEQLAGAGEHAADRAATKYPHLVREWFDQMVTDCGSSELSQ